MPALSSAAIVCFERVAGPSVHTTFVRTIPCRVGALEIVPRNVSRTLFSMVVMGQQQRAPGARCSKHNDPQLVIAAIVGVLMVTAVMMLAQIVFSS